MESSTSESKQQERRTDSHGARSTLSDLMKIALFIIALVGAVVLLQPKDKAAETWIYVFDDSESAQCTRYPAIIIETFDEERAHYWVYEVKIDGKAVAIDHGDLEMEVTVLHRYLELIAISGWTLGAQNGRQSSGKEMPTMKT